MADPSTNTEMVRVPILGENGRISDDYVPQEIPDSVATVTQKATEAAQSASNASASASAASQSANAAATSETNAAGSAHDASAAATDATNQAVAAKGHSDTAKSYSDSASQSALAASGYVTSAAQSAGDAANSASVAQTSATQAAASASGASASAAAADGSARAAKASEIAAGSSAEQAATSATQASSSAEAAAGSAQTATEKADSVLDHYIESAQATTLDPGSQATASVADKILTIGVPKGEKGDTGLGIPEGGFAGQVVKKTADGAEWAYDTGAVYNSEEGLQEMAEDGTNDPIYNFGITQGGMSASMSVMGDSPEVAVDYSKSSVSYRNAIGADADGPYVDLNLSGESDGATKYRYVDDVNSMPTTDGIPTAKAAYAAAKGNVLSGTKTGVVVTADDAYATKPRRLTVYGATRQNLWVNPSGTSDGITVTSNADGSITVGGTSTASVTTYFNVSHRIYTLKPETTYTLSVDKAFTGMYVSIREDDSSGSAITTHSVQSGVLTFQTKANMANCLFFVSVAAGSTVSGTYRVMLNEGSEAQPWCPPGLNGVDELSIVTAGKNLLARMGPSLPYTIAGITFSDNGDGGIRVSGTATAAAYYNFFNTATRQVPFILAGTYTAKLTGRVSGTGLTVQTFDHSVVGTYTPWIGDGSSTSTTGTLESSKYLRPYLFVSRGTIVDTVVYPQLELGSSATAYEPPNVTTTPIDLDGHTLNSLPDGTCDELTIDATGAVTLVQRVGAKVLPSDAASWRKESGGAGLRYSTGISPDAVNNYVPGSVVSDAVPYRAAQGDSYGGTHIIAAGSRALATVGTDETAQDIADVCGGKKLLYTLAEPQTIPLTPVTLPTLPSPNITVYTDSDVPSDITLEYECDVTIAFDKLEVKISELTVNQATN